MQFCVCILFHLCLILIMFELWIVDMQIRNKIRCSSWTLVEVRDVDRFAMTLKYDTLTLTTTKGVFDRSAWQTVRMENGPPSRSIITAEIRSSFLDVLISIWQEYSSIFARCMRRVSTSVDSPSKIRKWVWFGSNSYRFTSASFTIYERTQYSFANPYKSPWITSHFPISSYQWNYRFRSRTTTRF